MKHILSIIILSAMSLLAGCTHNNGDIGPLFGQWIMTGITVNGDTPADINPTEWNWRFQNQVFLISHVDVVAHDYRQYWGSWTMADKTMTIDYDNIDSAIDYAYETPSAIGFTDAAVYTLSVVNLSSHDMILQMVNPGGDTYVYTLKKN